MFSVVALREEFSDEVRSFLASDPIGSFGLMSFLARNGLESPSNRGEFVGFRDDRGKLQGVALLGHFTLFRVNGEDVIESLVRAAEKRSDLHLILAERGTVSRFWELFPHREKMLHTDVAYALLEMDAPPSIEGRPPTLRPAEISDLESVVAAHAQVTFEERGIDPLAIEPEEFTRRCLDRILDARTWIHTNGEEVLFKAELMSQTEDLAYLEAVWTKPGHRGKGQGHRCLVALCSELLKTSRSVCLLTETGNARRLAFYRRAGFRRAGHYTASFVLKNDDQVQQRNGSR